MNKVKIMVLAIMMMFIVNVSVFCVLVYSLRNIQTSPFNMNGSPSMSSDKTINIQNGEILIVNKCEKK
jgi:heme/copper-type cytochrome/quinol oxidase subunit 2